MERFFPVCILAALAAVFLVPPRNVEEQFDEMLRIAVREKDAKHPASGRGGRMGYTVNGKPALSLRRGRVYAFDQGDASNEHHEAYVAASWAGDPYEPDSQAYEGTAGTPGARLVFSVPPNAPSRGLFLACKNHAFMGFPIGIS
jgi:hypothetical protein